MDDDRTPREPDPPEPELFEAGQLDELLSAELDGELVAAARERGESVEAITARIDATPGADARRHTLVAARDLLAVTPEIDELLAQRLRAKAIRAAAEEHSARELDRRRRRRQVYLGAVGIAAAAVAVVALAGGLRHDNGSRTASEKAAPSSPAVSPTTGATGTGSAAAPNAALGAFSEKRTLADAAVVHAAALTAGGATGYTANQAATGNRAQELAPAAAVAAPTNRDSGVSQDSLAFQKAAAATSTVPAGHACPAPSGVAADDKLVLRATATLAGKAVIVFVFSGHGEHAVQIEDTHCAIVTIEMRS